MHLMRHSTLLLLLALAALSVVDARASDISCATTQQPAERVICDHAILNNEYEDIVSQQQTMLSAGKLSPGQLSQWRQSRNACTDVHCIDTVFAQWNTTVRAVASTPSAAVAPEIASASASAPVGPDPDAVPSPASAAVATSDSSVVQRGSAAGVALPQPVASQTSSPVAASAASDARESRNGIGISGGMSSGVMAAILIAIGCGAFVSRRRKNVRPTRKP